MPDTRKTLLDTARADAARIMQEAERKAELAELWDSTGYERTQPRYFFPCSANHYAGAVGHFGFSDVPVYDVLALLDRFPPIACGYYRDGSTSTVRPIGSAGERYVLRQETDGLLLWLGGGHGYGQTVKAEWWTEIDGRRVDITCELRADTLLPRIQARAVCAFGHTFIRYEGADNLVAPLGFGGEFLRYGRGSETALQDFLCYSAVRDYLERVQRENDAKGCASLAAYTAAAAGLPAPRAATDAEIETARPGYDRKKMRAGTLRQTATLATDEAQQHRAVAEKHWQEYAKTRGIDAGRCGFSHYDWACWYLAQCGLLDDAGAKYGAAWY